VHHELAEDLIDVGVVRSHELPDAERDPSTLARHFLAGLGRVRERFLGLLLHPPDDRDPGWPKIISEYCVYRTAPASSCSTIWFSTPMTLLSLAIPFLLGVRCGPPPESVVANPIGDMVEEPI
jgi:hypothetical protein